MWIFDSDPDSLQLKSKLFRPNVYKMGATGLMTSERVRISLLKLRSSMRRLCLPFLLLGIAGLACNALAAGGDTDEAVVREPGEYQGMNLEALVPHRARFSLQFDGQRSWLYRVETRKSSEAIEHSLHIEGVSDARNPGDVRMVTRDQESRMLGPGTDGECLRFPRSMEMNVTFLGPDDLIPSEAFREPLVPLGIEQVAGRESVHYALVQSELDRWQEVKLGIWLEPDSGAVLRYDLNASGNDPYFGAGFGVVEGHYEVLEVGPQSIEPIQGCDIQFPLPSPAENLVRLPGMVSFETSMGLDETVAFYRRELEGAGWQPLGGEERSSGAILMSYRKGQERLSVTIRTMDGLTRVELLTGQ